MLIRQYLQSHHKEVEFALQHVLTKDLVRAMAMLLDRAVVNVRK